MANLSTLRTEISSVLSLDTGNSAELSLIDGWINEGVVDLVLRTECKVLPGKFTLTAGTADYTLPDLLSIIDMYVSSGDVNYALERVTPAELLGYRRDDNVTENSPIRLYAVDGSNLLMVYPTPSAADEVHFTYVPRPATLSATASSPDEIPTEWHKLVVFYALMRGADYDDDASSQIGEKYREWYELGLREMRKVLHRKGGHRLPRIRVNRRRRMLVPHDPSTDTG